jgi:hypothetical protein
MKFAILVHFAFVLGFAIVWVYLRGPDAATSDFVALSAAL